MRGGNVQEGWHRPSTTTPEETFKGRGQGFPGQRIVVLPRRVVAQALREPLLKALLPTDAGWFPKAHGHYRQRSEGAGQAIFIYCANGSGWCELRGRRHDIHAGDLLVIQPGEPHAYGASENTAWTISWAHAAGDQTAPLLKELGVSADAPVVYLGEDPQVLALFEQLLDTLERGYAPHYLLYASQTLTHLIGAMIWRGRQTWRGTPDLKQRIGQSIAYMKEHLDQHLRVPRLAALANLSASHYSAVFKEQTGYSPLDYVIRLRMHRACQLLDTTELPVKEIAVRLGYEDQLYFSRLFRQVNDVAPTEYRGMRKG